MRPLEELRNGNVRAQRSLLLKYTSVPPPLVAWRALKSRDVFLVTLTFTAVVANVLTVALSGLFTQEQIFRGETTGLPSAYLPSFLARNTSDTRALILDSYNQNDAFYVASANFTNRTSLPPWTSQHYYFLPSWPNANLPNDGSVKITLQAAGFGADLDCREMTTAPSEAMYAISFNPNATLLSFVTSTVLSDGSIAQCTTFGGATGPDPSKNYLNLAGNPQGRKALELTALMQPLPNRNVTVVDQESCASLIVRGWVRANFSSLGGQMDFASNLSNENLATVSSTFISCRARPKSAVFNITISPSGEILASTQVSPATYDLPLSTNLTLALTTTSNNLGQQNQPVWHDDTFASDWSNYLFKTLTSSAAFLEASSPPPSFDIASAVVNETYSRVFAIQMSLQSAQLASAPPESPHIVAEVLTLERRVFISETMFRISMAILSLDLIVAMLFYSRAPKPFLPRLPTSIASQMAYFGSSHVVDDVKNAGGDLSELDMRGYRYGYGKYIGKDGRTHVGIEREPYVTHLPKSRTRL